MICRGSADKLRRCGGGCRTGLLAAYFCFFGSELVNPPTQRIQNRAERFLSRREVIKQTYCSMKKRAGNPLSLKSWRAYLLIPKLYRVALGGAI